MAVLWNADGPTYLTTCLTTYQIGPGPLCGWNPPPTPGISTPVPWSRANCSASTAAACGTTCRPTGRRRPGCRWIFASAWEGATIPAGAGETQWVPLLVVLMVGNLCFESCFCQQEELRQLRWVVKHLKSALNKCRSKETF